MKMSTFSDVAPTKATEIYLPHRRPQCQYRDVTINIVTLVKYIRAKLRNLQRAIFVFSCRHEIELTCGRDNEKDGL